MNNLPTIQCKNDNTYFLSGVLNYETVPVLWQQSLKVLKNKGQSLVIFDLGGVSQSDSSGVALLIAWIRSFRRQSQATSFIHLPSQMLAIIQLAGLEAIVPIKV